MEALPVSRVSDNKTDSVMKQTASSHWGKPDGLYTVRRFGSQSIVESDDSLSGSRSCTCLSLSSKRAWQITLPVDWILTSKYPLFCTMGALPRAAPVPHILRPLFTITTSCPKKNSRLYMDDPHGEYTYTVYTKH